MTASSPPSIKVIYAFLPIIVVTGFIQLLIPSTIHMIMKHFHIETGVAGILPLIYFSGILTCTILVTHLIKKYSVKQLISLGALLASISLLAASQINNFYIFALLYFTTGFGTGLLMILPGIYSTHIFGKKSAQLQSLIFAFLAVGFIIGPIFPGIIEYLNMSWRWCFAFPGFLILPMLIPVILSKHEPIDNAEKLTFRIAKEIIQFDKRFFIGIVIVLILGTGSATAFMTWIITFLENNRGTDLGVAHIILSGVGLCTFAGRRLWGKVASHRRVYKTLLMITPMAMIFVFIAPFPANVNLNIALFMVAIIFISGINPLALSSAAIYPQSHASSTYTLLFSSSSIGGMIVPFGIGQIFQHFGAVIGMSSIALLLLFVVFALLFIRKEIPLSEHIHRHLMP